MKISQRSKSDRVRIWWLPPILLALALGLVLSGCSVKSGGAPGGGDSDAPSGIIMSLTDSAPGAEYRTRTISWRMPAQVKESALYYEEVTEGAAKAKEPSPRLPRLIPGALVPETDESATDYGQYSHFEAEMTDLHEGEYTYRVGTEENLSDPVTFRIGAPDEPQTAFLFFGDVQPDGGLDDYKVFSSILTAAYKEHPDAAFGLQVGDIGNVGNAGEEWTEFLNRAQPVFDKIPLMTAVGNHEITPYVTRFAGKPLRYLDAFALPKNGPYGYEEEFYSFDYGQVHVLVLSSNYQDPQESYSADGAERDQIAARVAGWIAEDLSSTEKPHSIVMMHHPIFPIVSDSMTAGLQDEWLPIFMGAGVELVLVGHQHEYMRTKPWMSGTSGGGLVQIMANSSQKTYPISGSGLGYIEVEIGDTQGYLYITATEDSLEVTAYNAKGRIIDTWTSEPTKEGKKAA